MTDVLHFHTPDGGEIEFINGSSTMSEGLETVAYYSLFGGNEQDSGLAGDDSRQWWGNLGETDPARRMRSATQNALVTLPITPANRLRFEDAAKRDLAWMVTSQVATSVSVSVTITGVDRLSIDGEILVNDVVYPFSFPYSRPK